MGEVLLALPLGAGIGLAIGLLGGGGSVLAVPVLVYLLGQTVPEATTASLAVVAAGALAGGVAHAREQRVCWRHAAAFAASALPGIVAGTLAGDAVSDTVTLVAFAVIMLVAARATWAKGDDEDDPGPGDHSHTCPPLRLPKDVAAGVAVGFATGFLGVGGGFLVVPTLAVGLAFTMRTAVGTSLVIITATSLSGLGVHLLLGRGAELDVSAALTGTCALGALAGVWLSSRVEAGTLARAFAVMVLIVAAYVLVSALLVGAPTSTG